MIKYIKGVLRRFKKPEKYVNPVQFTCHEIALCQEAYKNFIKYESTFDIDKHITELIKVG